MVSVPNAENFNRLRLSRAHERYRQTTDARTIAYSARELTFTFAENWCHQMSLLQYGGSYSAPHVP